MAAWALGIQTDQAHVSRQLAQVAVQDEAERFERPSEECHIAHVDALKARKHGNTIPLLHETIEGFRLSVDENQIHFRMRDAQSLDEILHRFAALEGMSEGDLAATWWQEVIEWTVHPDDNVLHAPV